MKKLLSVLLAVLMLCGLLVMSVSAVDADKNGIYALSKESGVTVTVKKADGTTVSSVSKTIDSKSENIYEEAEKLTVTVSSTSGKYYLAVATNDGVGTLAPTESNIVYIDQKTASGTSVSFDIYPSNLEDGKTYTVFVSSNDGNGVKKVVSFKYFAPYIVGDVDGNKNVDSLDALMALKIAAKLISNPTKTQQLAADVDKNGTIDSLDALGILKIAAHLV